MAVTQKDRINAVPTKEETEKLRQERQKKAGLADIGGDTAPETGALMGTAGRGTPIVEGVVRQPLTNTEWLARKAEVEADAAKKQPPTQPKSATVSDAEKAEAAAAHEERQAAVDAPRAAADKLPGALEGARQKDQEYEELYAKHEARREDLSRQFGEALFPGGYGLRSDIDTYHEHLLAAHESGHVTLSPEMLDATKEARWMRDREQGGTGYGRPPISEPEWEARGYVEDVWPATQGARYPRNSEQVVRREMKDPGNLTEVEKSRRGRTMGNLPRKKAEVEERSRVSRGLPRDGQLPSAE